MLLNTPLSQVVIMVSGGICWCVPPVTVTSLCRAVGSRASYVNQLYFRVLRHASGNYCRSYFVKQTAKHLHWQKPFEYLLILRANCLVSHKRSCPLVSCDLFQAPSEGSVNRPWRCCRHCLCVRPLSSLFTTHCSNEAVQAFIIKPAYTVLAELAYVLLDEAAGPGVRACVKT